MTDREKQMTPVPAAYGHYSDLQSFGKSVLPSGGEVWIYQHRADKHYI